jgi:hypothetical protein
MDNKYQKPSTAFSKAFNQPLLDKVAVPADNISASLAQCIIHPKNQVDGHTCFI